MTPSQSQFTIRRAKTEAQWPTIERFLSTWHPTATPKTYSDEQRKADQASLDSLFED
jgi:hypothetical protein